MSSLKIAVMRPGVVLGHFKTGQLPPFSAYFAEFEFDPMSMNPELLAKAKSLGFSDRQIAHLTGQTEDAVREIGRASCRKRV